MSETTSEAVPDIAPEPVGAGLQMSGSFLDSTVGFLEAVRITGRGKSTLSRDLRSGKLPFVLLPDGQRRYRVMDLELTYGLRKPTEPGAEPVPVPVPAPVPESLGNQGDMVGIAVLEERLRASQEALRVKESENAYLRAALDKQQDATIRITMLLPAPAAAPAAKRPWWRFGG